MFERDKDELRALGIPIGVSIGRNKLTANEFAVDDYTRALLAAVPPERPRVSAP